MRDRSASIEAIAAVVRDDSPITERSAVEVLRAKLSSDERWRLASLAFSILDANDFLIMADNVAEAAAMMRRVERERAQA